MSRVAYVVYRQAYYDTGELCSDGHDDDLGSRVALGAYAERPRAEARLAELTRVARRTANPFTLRYPLPLAGLVALGLPWRVAPPADREGDGLEPWYDAEAAHLSDDERAKVWALFDARPLYGVYEVPLGD